jgi:large subunit ribosomal protein L13
MVVIDADGAVVGRLGARIAKLLLAGQQVEIINAEKAVMLGSLSAAKEHYLSRRGQQDKRSPENSPHWPRAPHLLLRRIMRGMLPWSSQRGRDAYHRLRVTVGIPSQAGVSTTDLSGRTSGPLVGAPTSRSSVRVGEHQPEPHKSRQSGWAGGAAVQAGKPVKLKEASSDAKHGYFTLQDLCRELGYHSKNA